MKIQRVVAPVGQMQLKSLIEAHVVSPSDHLKTNMHVLLGSLLSSSSIFAMIVVCNLLVERKGFYGKKIREVMQWPYSSR